MRLAAPTGISRPSVVVAVMLFFRDRFAFRYCKIHFLVTHADDSRTSKAMSGLCDSVCLSVCPHVKKTAEITITKLGTGIDHHDDSPTSEY